MKSRFYRIDPNDPDAPMLLTRYNDLTPDMAVVYIGPMPLPGPLTVTELVRFDDGDDGYTLAVLNDGEYEVDASNLAPA